MKRFLPFVLLYLAGPSLAFGHPQSVSVTTPTSSAAVYDVPSFTAELHRLSAAIGKNPSAQKLGALRDSLPAQWIVKTPEQTYSIPTAPLRGQLTVGTSGKAQAWLDHLARESDSYAAANAKPGAASANAHAELTKILNESEFAAVRLPSAWELFRQRIEAWLERMLLKIFSGLTRYPIGGQILFWLIIIAGVGFVAFWLFRFVTSRDRIQSLSASEVFGPSRSWQEWIRAAREAANRNDFREAVHSAYWAGIVRLEDTGVVPRDRTKTPREYLRLAAEHSPYGSAPRTDYRRPLAELTSRLERIWYANRGAGADDFRDSLRQLEALGCQLE